MVKLSDKYYIGADKYNWIVYEKDKNKKTGEIKYSAVKFYPTLDVLLAQTLKSNLRGLIANRGDLMSLAIKMSNEIEKFSGLARTLCEGIKKGGVEPDVNSK